MNLSYAEVPIQFNYHDKDRLIFGAGFYAAALVKAKLQQNGLEIPGAEDAFERREFGYLITATFLIKKKLGIGIRYSATLNSIGTSGISNLPKNKMRNRGMTLRTMYLF
jgi:hypothetical protein